MNKKVNYGEVKLDVLLVGVDIIYLPVVTLEELDYGGNYIVKNVSFKIMNLTAHLHLLIKNNQYKTALQSGIKVELSIFQKKT